MKLADAEILELSSEQSEDDSPGSGMSRDIRFCFVLLYTEQEINSLSVKNQLRFVSILFGFKYTKNCLSVQIATEKNENDKFWLSF